MAIKIRCVDCKKKISIDEAFAGGVCRCPYCTAIVYVPDDAAVKKDKKGRAEKPKRRPTAPSRRPESPTTTSKPSRPESPMAISEDAADPMADTAIDAPLGADPMADTALDAPAGVDTLAETSLDIPNSTKPWKTASKTAEEKALAAAKKQANIPTAAPVKVQGIVAMVLSGLLVVMLSGMIYIAVIFTQPPIVETRPDDYNQTAFTQKDVPSIAGKIEITAPVIYCIDTSKPMAEVFDAAEQIVLVSIKSLKGGQFNVILIGEDDDKIMSPKPIASDPAGLTKAKEFIEIELCGEGDQVRALQAALAMDPKSVVILAKDNVRGLKGKVEAAFKTKSVPLHAVILGSKSRGLEDLAKATGGKSRAFTLSDLAAQAKRALK